MEAFIAVLVISLTAILTQVECKFCSYPGPAGTSIPITCASYEYCCSRGCCRSPSLMIYQLWYFWLSIFLIIMLCSGGGWWYRLKNRDTLYSQPRTTIGTNAFYYPNSDRVVFQNLFKDIRFSQRPITTQTTIYTNQQPPPPPPPQYHHTPQLPPQQYQYAAPPPGFRNLPPTTFANGPPPPPPYMGPPPSYESVLHHGKG